VAELAGKDAAGVVEFGVAGVVVPVAARLDAEGDVAGCNPSTTGGCGVDCADGSAGSAVRAITEVSSGAASLFHQAQRGPDWHPAIEATTARIDRAQEAEFLMCISGCVGLEVAAE
jgi:hypothetical protein